MWKVTVVGRPGDGETIYKCSEKYFFGMLVFAKHTVEIEDAAEVKMNRIF